MKPRRRALPIAVGLAALALVAAACSSGSGSGSSNGKITITEFDYFTSGGSNTAVNWYNKKFEAAHPNVTIKRESVPFANLITKVLQDASAQDMPSIVMLDNPNIPQVAATGQLRPFNNLPGFTTQGYYAGSMNECKF
jgi:multiple sugar transport system substrate-binding protein